MWLGEMPQVAAATIARRAQKWPVWGETALTASTIIGWRQHFKGSEAEKREKYEALVADIKAQESPKQIIETLLEHGPPATPKLKAVPPDPDPNLDPEKSD